MMMCRLVVLAFGLSLTSVVADVAQAAPAGIRSQNAKEVKPIREHEALGEELVSRRAVCRRAEKPPVLDGKLDDPCWQKADAIDHFATFWTDPKIPRKGTVAYLVWDDEAIYYAGSMTDAELRSFGTRRNDSLWNGDVFELFLKPSGDRPEYYEFQANPRGIVFEIAFPKRGHTFIGGFTAHPLWAARLPSS